jgi:hypothetical protein
MAEHEITRKHIAGWAADARQKRAAQAAVAALQNGSTDEQAEAFAKAAYESEDIPDQDDAPDAPAEVDPVEIQRYLIAVCNIGRGQFETLDNAQLLDAACLVNAPIMTLSNWQQVRQRFLK